jgi:hypothetical protein
LVVLKAVPSAALLAAKTAEK